MHTKIYIYWEFNLTDVFSIAEFDYMVIYVIYCLVILTNYKLNVLIGDGD